MFISKNILNIITSPIQRDTVFEGHLNSKMLKEYPSLLQRQFISTIHDFYPDPAQYRGLSEVLFSACSLGNDREVHHQSTV